MIKNIESENQVSYPETNVERPLSESDWKSIYIPIIPDDLVALNGSIMTVITQEKLTDIIQNELRIGEVSRIDYVTTESADDKKSIKSAYIHFKTWYDNAEVESLRNELNTKGSKRYYSFGIRPTQYTFKTYDEQKEIYVNRYLVFKINHKPLQEAPEGLNIHQLHAANEFLNNLVKEKNEEIEALNKVINELNEKLALLLKNDSETNN
jgi:vacuolar-type H+-ATPase subunit I/STV1